MIKKIVHILIFVIPLFIVSGCYKTATVTVNNGQEITREVSFASDVAPLLIKNCSASGCHNAGGHPPELTEAKSYNALINGNYVNIASPTESEIYLWLTGKKMPAMPMGATSNPSNINQFVLAWIKQGAKNN